MVYWLHNKWDHVNLRFHRDIRRWQAEVLDILWNLESRSALEALVQWPVLQVITLTQAWKSTALRRTLSLHLTARGTILSPIL